MGGRLLDRVGKRNELTPLGADVVLRSRHIVRDAAELRDSAKLLQGVGKRTLRVGLGSGPAALLLEPLLLDTANQPGMRLTVTHGSVELQILGLRSRDIDAMVVDMRRVVPASDLNIEALPEMKAGFVVRRGHPLAGSRNLELASLLEYPIASTPLSEEVARQLISQYGHFANPAEMVTIRSDDIKSLVRTVEQTDAIFLGAIAAAQSGITDGRLTELRMKLPLTAKARFACVTLAGRTEAPAMTYFRSFVDKHLKR